MADLSLIKKLREATGCGIADCNKALAENKDDFEKSIDWLRKKGLSSASKKAGRVASEGLVAGFLVSIRTTCITTNTMRSAMRMFLSLKYFFIGYYS